MNISAEAVQATAKPILESGQAGFKLVQATQLPAKLFPVTAAWNMETLSLPEPDEAKWTAQVRGLQANQPFGLRGDKDGYAPSVDDSAAAAFQLLNAQFLRSHSSTRLWSNTERYNLLPRLDSGGAIIVAKFRLDDDTTTPPLIVFTGPVGALPPNKPFNISSVHPVTDDPNDALLTEDLQPYPPDFAPLAFSLSPDSRTWLATSSPSSRQDILALLSQARIATCPDARSLLSSVIVQDNSDSFSTVFAQQPDNPFVQLGLWIPDDWDVAKSKVVPALQPILSLSTGHNPVCPVNAPNPWVDPKAPSQTATKHCDEATPTFGNHIPINTNPTAEPPTSADAVTSGSLVIPLALRTPPTTGLPVGLIINPKDLSYLDIMLLIAHLAYEDDVNELNWFMSQLVGPDVNESCLGLDQE